MKYLILTIYFLIILLLMSCSHVIETKVHDKNTGQDLFPKMKRGTIERDCLTENLGKQYIFIGILDETITLEGKNYNPFIISQLEDKIFGYLRIEKDIVYYMPKGFGRENECNEEIEFLKFKAKAEEQWFVDCLDAITEARVTLNSIRYDEILKDSLFDFSIVQKRHTPHMSTISNLIISKKYGFTNVILSEPRKDTIVEVCNLNLID